MILTKPKSVNAGPISGTGEGVAHSKRWYVALVRMHHEKKVSERLSKMGIDSFVPVQQQIHQWSDRRKMVDTVLLPMMVFVHVNPKERMEVLSFSTVSRYMVMRGESTPAVIPDEQMARFRFMLDYSEEAVILDVNGIGYEIKISGDTAAALPSIGERMKLYTYTYVREDAFCLYGFLTKDDLEIFKKLITVSGIGPKGGLAVLSVMSADDLRFAIMSGDARMIATAPGIGKKTAERVILDLRDKISMEDTMIHRRMTEQTAQDSFADDNQIRTEAVEALTALGYSAQEALQAVKKVVISEEMDVEAVLKAALKNMF